MPSTTNPNGNHDKFPSKSEGGRDLQVGWDYIRTYKEMEKLLSTGKVKAISVSNHSVLFLTKLLGETTVVPAVKQIENHPLLPQGDVVALYRKKGIVTTTYSLLGSAGGPSGGLLLSEEKVLKVTEKHGFPVGTMLLNYHIVLAKSITPSRIDENNKLLKLDDEDLELLEGIYKEKGPKRLITPPWPINFGFPD